jgi:hypothetical protein
MAQLNNHKVTFSCVCCHEEIIRPATPADYLGRFDMPPGWGSLRVLSDYYDYCGKPDCQALLNTLEEVIYEPIAKIK